MSQQKKLEKAYNEGIEQGVTDACYIWEKAITQTRGIGETLKKRIMGEVNRVILSEAERGEVE